MIPFIQLLPCGRNIIAVVAPEIVIAALTVPTHIRVRGIRVMTDDKLVTPDSTALYDFIAPIGAFFFVHRHLSFFGILPICLFACCPKPLHTGVA